MTAMLSFLPGRPVRWRDRHLVVVDYQDLGTLIAQEPGNKHVIRVPVVEVQPVPSVGDMPFRAPDLTSVDERAWESAVRQLEAIKPLLEINPSKRTLADVKKVAEALNRHPATIYRWMDEYERTRRLSVFLRKERSDQGTKRLSPELEQIIEQAIKDKYLTEERPDVAAVIEEVELRCFEKKIKKPHPNTVRRRVSMVSDRTKLEKRHSKKTAAERYEPLRGSFPGASYPLAVVQIDHTPMDVIVVDEHDRQPIDRPWLTIVIDVFSRMVLGFAIYLEKPSAFTSGLAIAHAVLPKEEWLAELNVNADWPCWGKMRKIHCDNAKEFRGTVIGRACEEHDITVEHRPKGQPRYGGHVERGFRTFMRRTHQLKGTTFSNVEEKADYDSSGRARMTRQELERWFTIYIAKVYPNRFHWGISNTPLAKYKEGILGSDSQPGIGLPERITDPQSFMLDFMPYEERTVQEYGILIDHIYYYDDALRHWIHARDPNEPKRARKFIVRVIPRDMREVYFRDPVTQAYIAIPYRDRSHPPVSRWEVLAAETRLRKLGYANVNEALIFEAILEMRDIEEEAERKTKKIRREKEKRERPPRMPAKLGSGPLRPSAAPPSPAVEPVSPSSGDDDPIGAFDGIVEPD